MLALLAGAVAGGFWGMIPGVLKITRGQNEMIISIMLNYVATLFMGVIYTSWIRDASVPQTPAIDDAVHLPRIISGMRMTWGLVIAVVVGLLLYYFLFWTSPGFKLRAVGLNQTASRFNGFPVRRYMLMSFIVSGAIAGLGGGAELLGTQFRLINGFGAGYGFDGVAMALIGQLHPIATMVVALVFCRSARGLDHDAGRHGRADQRIRYHPGACHRLLRRRYGADEAAGVPELEEPRVRQEKGRCCVMDWILSLLLATVRLAIPVLLISLAELYGQRAGMVNIGLEGLASIGALVGFLVCYVTGSNWLGLLCGALAGILVNMIYAFSTVTLCADHTVYGMAVNIFAPALASFIYRVYFGTGSDLKQITTMASIAIPGLKDIPVIGPLLFDQSPMVYLTFVLVIVTAVFFGKTRAGLSYKSVGEHPQAAATLGINVIGVKYLACVICGALAGIGGAYLTTCYSSTLHRRHRRRARLHRAGRRHLRPLERRRHSACLPVLRLL